MVCVVFNDEQGSLHYTASASTFMTTPIRMHQSDQAIVICLDIEDHSTALENTCLRMNCLYVLRRLPSRALHYDPPRIVLRSGGLDPSISGSRRKIALDDIGASGIARRFTGIY
jgi:hypothetical protein